MKLVTPSQIRAIAREVAQKKKLPKTPKGDYPIGVERSYRRQLRQRIRAAKVEILKAYKNEFERLAKESLNERPGVRQDASNDLIERIIEGVRLVLGRALNADDIQRIASESMRSVDEITRKNTERQFKRVLGIEVIGSDPKLESFIRARIAENVSLITSIPDQFIPKIQNGMFRLAQQGTRVEDISRSLEDLIDKEVSNIEARANLIARDQVGKANGLITQARQQSLGLTRYVWRTMKDERVRPMHADLEGEVINWDDPPITNSAGDRNHAGFDFQCRCYADPVIEDLTQSSDEE